MARDHAPHRFDPADHEPIVGRRVLVALALPVGTGFATLAMLLLGLGGSEAPVLALPPSMRSRSALDALADAPAGDLVVGACFAWLAIATVATAGAVLAGARRTWTLVGAWIGSIALAWVASLALWGPAVLASAIPWGVVIGLALRAIARTDAAA